MLATILFAFATARIPLLRTRCISIRDLDGDGKPDLAVDSELLRSCDRHVHRRADLDSQRRQSSIHPVAGDIDDDGYAEAIVVTSDEGDDILVLSAR